MNDGAKPLLFPVAVAVKFCPECMGEEFKIMRSGEGLFVRCSRCLTRPGPPYKGVLTFAEEMELLDEVPATRNIIKRLGEEFDQLAIKRGGRS